MKRRDEIDRSNPFIPSDTSVPTALAPQVHGGTADSKARGDFSILITRQGHQDDPAPKRHLLGCALGGFPSFLLALGHSDLSEKSVVPVGQTRGA